MDVRFGKGKVAGRCQSMLYLEEAAGLKMNLTLQVQSEPGPNLVLKDTTPIK